MNGPDVTAIYEAKAVEYLIAVLYLALFVPFWRYLSTAPAARVPARRPAFAGDGWFSVAPGVALHHGHAWAARAGTAVLLGLDDFAEKLIGPMKAIQLPPPGTRLRQGEPAWTVRADGKALEMLSPVDGVVEVANETAAGHPEIVSADPYGRGWLLRVRDTNWSTSASSLLSGPSARAFMEQTAEVLRARLDPQMGAVLQDGGHPVHGIAREIAPDDWDTLAREFLGTERKG